MTLTCTECGLPTYLTKDLALKMECSGIHFIQDGEMIVPIRSGNLRIGNRSLVLAETGKDISIGNNCDIYKCKIGSHTKIKHYVEIQGNVEIGQFCKIESYCFLCEGVRLGNYVFLGPRVTFTNDKYPSAVGEWQLKMTTVEDGASIGADVTILPGVKIGKGSLIGAGSLVTKDVKPDSIYFGSPAKFVRYI